VRGEVNEVHCIVAGNGSKHVQIKSLSLVQQPSLLLDPERLGDLQLLRSLCVLDFLDFDDIPATNRSMVTYIRLISSVENILHTLWITSTMHDAIAPRRDTSLLRGIILVRAAVIFVCWDKGDWGFCEGLETETWVCSHLL